MTKTVEKEVVVEEEDVEGYFCRRGFLTLLKVPVARRYHKIAFLGALFAGRATQSGVLVELRAVLS